MISPFNGYVETLGKISSTYLVSYERNRYSAPCELDGQLEHTVFRAVPQNPETLLYWHLDNQFLGTTQTFHQQVAQPAAGRHWLVVVDETGNTVRREFEVLMTPEKKQ